MERMPDHVHPGRIVAALPRRRPRLPPRVGCRSPFSEWQFLLRYPPAFRVPLWRTLVFRAVCLLWNRPARPEGSLCGLLGTERKPRTHPSRPLRKESAASQGVQRLLLGPDLERWPRRLRNSLSRGGRWHHISYCRPVEHALCTQGGDPGDTLFPEGPWRWYLGPIWIRRCLLRSKELVRRYVSLHRSGTNRRHDRELSHGSSVETVHERAGNTRLISSVELY